jgi:hypothetical protein
MFGNSDVFAAVRFKMLVMFLKNNMCVRVKIMSTTGNQLDMIVKIQDVSALDHCKWKFPRLKTGIS